MPNVQRLRFTATIAAPPSRVYELLIRDDTYRRWTAPFCEGSYFEGSWAEGERIRFLGPSGDGMVAEIAVNRPHEHISIRHLGLFGQGVEDTESEAVRAWAPAYENYTFLPDGPGTRLEIEMDTASEWAAHMEETWPKALAVLKAVCEG
jgi:hypothetical protein